MREQYGPARAPLVGEETRRPRSSLVAILLGGLVVDVIGSMLFGGALMTAVAIVAVGGGPGSSIEALIGSPAFLAIAAAGGSALVVAGGYTAAWWARRRPLAHALGAGCLSFGAAFGGVWMQGEARALWIHVALLALHLPLAALGGHLFARSQPAV